MGARDDRERLIDVGLDVCCREGYEAATLGDIAAAARISEGELTEVFATKEAIAMAPADAMLIAVCAALADVDPDVKPVDALQAAHAKVLRDIIEGAGPISLERMQAMGMVMMNSPDLQKRMSAHRKETLSPVLAKRLGVAVSDPSVARAVTTWSAVVAATYSAAPNKRGEFDPVEDARRPARMHERLMWVFRIITGR